LTVPPTHVEIAALEASMEPNRPDTENPYAPPTSDVNAGKLPAAAPGMLAERGTRFVSQLVDGLLYLVVLIPAFIAGFESGAFKAFVAGPLGIVSLAGWLGLIIYQAYLVATSGQSIAKKLFKIQIVKVDGAPVNFVSGVLLRNWLMMVLQQIPVVNMILPLLDALFIFRQDRRCIHDLIAGTKVVQLAGSPQVRVA
jgi:uncharacterized RDD family membrane protein YckC